MGSDWQWVGGGVVLREVVYFVRRGSRCRRRGEWRFGVFGFHELGSGRG